MRYCCSGGPQSTEARPHHGPQDHRRRGLGSKQSSMLENPPAAGRTAVVLQLRQQGLGDAESPDPPFPLESPSCWGTLPVTADARSGKTGARQPPSSATPTWYLRSAWASTRHSRAPRSDRTDATAGSDVPRASETWPGPSGWSIRATLAR